MSNQRLLVFQRTDGRCFYCGCRLIFGTADNPSPINGFTVDHVVPGLEEPSNSVPACKSCNSSKGSRSIEQFRVTKMRKMGMLFTALQVAYWEGRGVQLPKAEPVLFWFEHQGLKVTEDRPAESGQDHKEFIEGWSKSFLEAWGTPYQFNGGRDGRAVKELVAKNIPVPELLKNAQIAWKVHKTNPKTWNCGQAATIHGFKERLMNIITEIAANKPPKALADKELDRISAL